MKGGVKNIMYRLPDIGYPQTGDIANPGSYACMNCPHKSKDDKAIVLLPKRGKLPKCPVCKSQTYWISL